MHSRVFALALAWVGSACGAEAPRAEATEAVVVRVPVAETIAPRPRSSISPTVLHARFSESTRLLPGPRDAEGWMFATYEVLNARMVVTARRFPSGDVVQALELPERATPIRLSLHEGQPALVFNDLEVPESYWWRTFDGTELGPAIPAHRALAMHSNLWLSPGNGAVVLRTDDDVEVLHVRDGSIASRHAFGASRGQAVAVAPGHLALVSHSDDGGFNFDPTQRAIRARVLRGDMPLWEREVATPAGGGGGGPAALEDESAVHVFVFPSSSDDDGVPIWVRIPRDGPVRSERFSGDGEFVRAAHRMERCGSEHVLLASALRSGTQTVLRIAVANEDGLSEPYELWRGAAVEPVVGLVCVGPDALVTLTERGQFHELFALQL